MYKEYKVYTIESQLRPYKNLSLPIPVGLPKELQNPSKPRYPGVRWANPLSPHVLQEGTIGGEKGKEQPQQEFQQEFPWCEGQDIVTPCSGFPWLNTSMTEKPIGF